MDPAQLDELMRLLPENELAISALYETFASIFPDHRKTWMAFSEEERHHAKWIEALHTHLKNESISFDQVKFTTQSVQASIRFIKDETAKAASHLPDLRQSLAVAVSVERSLLESAFFKIFKLTGPRASAIQTRLEEETKAHLQRLLDWKAVLVDKR